MIDGPTPPDSDVPDVVVRYWAGAKAAAGVGEEFASARTLGDLLRTLQRERDQSFARVLSLCSFVVSERPVSPQGRDEFVLHSGDVVDVLPPFAGGADPA